MWKSTVQEVFSTDPEFCAYCGSILPVPTGTALDNKCFVCQESVNNKNAGEVSYVVTFNDPDVYSKERGESSGDKKSKGKGKDKKEDIAEGPVVDRECRRCGHSQMSYATLQLRSADEGQTVFYTCMNQACRFKESENS